MKDFLENLNKLSKDLHLDQDRKADFRNELIRFMNENPIKEPKIINSNILAKFFAYAKTHLTILVPLVACAILILGAGTSFAAEGSLPGDILYPVKVNVNEEVRAALIFNVDDKVDFEISRAETRLSEADELAASGSLNATIQAQVQSKLDKYSERVQQRIQALADSGDTEKASDLASHFEASLQAHNDLLNVIGDKSSDNDNRDEGEGFKQFKKNINTQTGALVKRREDLDAKITSNTNQQKVQSAAAGKVGAAENTIAEVKKYIELKSQGGSVSTQGAQEKVKSAEAVLVQAKTKLSAGDYVASFDLAAKAQRQALSAKALVKVEFRLPERVKNELPNKIQRDSDEDNHDENRVPNESSLPRINF